MRRSRALSRCARTAVLAASLSGCVGATTTYRDPRVYEATRAEDVEVLAARPGRAHVVVASLCVDGETKTTTREQLVATLRREAAKLGGDAVVVTAEDDYGEFIPPALGYGSTTRNRRLLADVLVWADTNRPWGVVVSP